MAPADAETVCLFAQFLAKSFKAPQAIMNYVASVKLWHTLLDLDITLLHSIEFKVTKKGLFRIMQHTMRQASPITQEILMLFLQKLNLSNPMFWDLVLIVWCCVFNDNTDIKSSTRFSWQVWSRKTAFMWESLDWEWLPVGVLDLGQNHPEQQQNSQSSYYTHPRLSLMSSSGLSEYVPTHTYGQPTSRLFSHLQKGPGPGDL